MEVDGMAMVYGSMLPLENRTEIPDGVDASRE